MKLQSPVAHSCDLLNHQNSFCRWMFKFNGKFDADPLLYLLSHFDCESHTVHMLIHWHLLAPMTSTVKSSLFTLGHSSPLSLVARLHQRCGNHSHYINNGWTFFKTELICSLMFTGALFTLSKTWKHPKCPSIDNWIKEMWYIYATEYCSAITKDEILLFETTWMNLESIILRKISQTEKTKNYVSLWKP